MCYSQKLAIEYLDYREKKKTKPALLISPNHAMSRAENQSKFNILAQILLPQIQYQWHIRISIKFTPAWPHPITLALHWIFSSIRKQINRNRNFIITKLVKVYPYTLFVGKYGRVACNVFLWLFCYKHEHVHCLDFAAAT